MGFLDKLTERVGGIFGEFIEEVRIPDEVHIRLQRAATLHEQGKQDEALKILDRLEAERPDLARIHYLRGLCHFERGAPQEAARALRRALELREEPAAHFWAGLALERLGQARAAQEHLLRAAQLAPQAHFAFDLSFALGRVYLAVHPPQNGQLDS